MGKHVGRGGRGGRSTVVPSRALFLASNASRTSGLWAAACSSAAGRWCKWWPWWPCRCGSSDDCGAPPAVGGCCSTADMPSARGAPDGRQPPAVFAVTAAKRRTTATPAAVIKSDRPRERGPDAGRTTCDGGGGVDDGVRVSCAGGRGARCRRRGDVCLPTAARRWRVTRRSFYRRSAEAELSRRAESERASEREMRERGTRTTAVSGDGGLASVLCDCGGRPGVARETERSERRRRRDRERGAAKRAHARPDTPLRSPRPYFSRRRRRGPRGLISLSVSAVPTAAALPSSRLYFVSVPRGITAIARPGACAVKIQRRRRRRRCRWFLLGFLLPYFYFYFFSSSSSLTPLRLHTVCAHPMSPEDTRARKKNRKKRTTEGKK